MIPDEAVEAAAKAMRFMPSFTFTGAARAALEAAADALLAAERERIAQAIESLSELKLRDYPGSGPHVSKRAAARIARGES